MDNIVVAIAESRAELLHRLSNWGRYSTFDGSYDPRTFTRELDAEERQDVLLAKMTAEAAAARARETSREFAVVMREVEMEVAIHLARMLARPEEDVAEAAAVRVLAALKAVAVAVAAEDGGLVCGVCQEEMRLMEDAGRFREIIGCGDKYHQDCIVEWLKRKRTRPLFGYQLQDD